MSRPSGDVCSIVVDVSYNSLTMVIRCSSVSTLTRMVWTLSPPSPLSDAVSAWSTFAATGFSAGGRSCWDCAASATPRNR